MVCKVTYLIPCVPGGETNLQPRFNVEMMDAFRDSQHEGDNRALKLINTYTITSCEYILNKSPLKYKSPSLRNFPDRVD